MRTPRPSRNDSGSGYSCKHTRAAGAAALGGSRRAGAACVAFFFMENRSCHAWKPRADGERLGLIGAAASMEAGHRRSMLEARPFAVRTAALAHGLGKASTLRSRNVWFNKGLTTSLWSIVNRSRSTSREN